MPVSCFCIYESISLVFKRLTLPQKMAFCVLGCCELVANKADASCSQTLNKTLHYRTRSFLCISATTSQVSSRLFAARRPCAHTQTKTTLHPDDFTSRDFTPQGVTLHPVSQQMRKYFERKYYNGGLPKVGNWIQTIIQITRHLQPWTDREWTGNCNRNQLQSIPTVADFSCGRAKLQLLNAWPDHMSPCFLLLFLFDRW